MLKLSQQFFGLSSFAMYFLTKGLFFAGCVTLFFLLLAQVVPWLYAILGTLVFLFVPAHYSHVLWIADGVTMCYGFLFLGMLIFYTLQENILKRGSNKQFRWLLLALFVTGWTGIKTKEPMLMLPWVVFLYSLTRFRSWREAPVKFILLNAAMAFVAFQIVPVTGLQSSSVPSFHFSFGTLGRLLFKNYACGYDNETISAFFSWDHVFPVSIARTLGFFMLWSIIISLISVAWRKWVRKDKNMIPYWGHSLVKICGIWFLAELPFLGMFQPDPRYFSGTVAPVIILIARLVYCAAKGAGKGWGTALLLLWAISIGFSISENAQSCLSVRLVMGRKLNYFPEIARTVLEDLKKKKVPDDLEVGEFYATIGNDDASKMKIRDYVFYANPGFGYEGWNQVPLGQDSLDNFDVQSGNGYKYYITVKDIDLSGRAEIRQIGTIDGINKNSLLEKLIYSKKKKRPAKVHIFKHE